MCEGRYIAYEKSKVSQQAHSRLEGQFSHNRYPNLNLRIPCPIQDKGPSRDPAKQPQNIQALSHLCWEKKTSLMEVLTSLFLAISLNLWDNILMTNLSINVSSCVESVSNLTFVRPENFFPVLLSPADVFLDSLSSIFLVNFRQRGLAPSYTSGVSSFSKFIADHMFAHSKI